MIPLFAFLEGDTLGLLLLAQPQDTSASLVAKVLQMSRTRVSPEGPYVLIYQGKEQANELKMNELAFSTLDRVDIRKKVMP